MGIATEPFDREVNAGNCKGKHSPIPFKMHLQDKRLEQKNRPSKAVLSLDERKMIVQQRLVVSTFRRLKVVNTEMPFISKHPWE